MNKRIVIECPTCKNDAIITPTSVDILGDCPHPDKCMNVWMPYIDTGLMEKDFNMLSMLFPKKKMRYGEAASYFTTQIRDMMERLRIEYRMVVEDNKVKVWINADAPNHVSLQ